MLVIADQAWNFIILWIRVCSLDEICLRFVCLKVLQVERVANDSLHSLHLTTRIRPGPGAGQVRTAALSRRGSEALWDEAKAAEAAICSCVMSFVV